MSTKPLHDFTPIPPGKTARDVLPAWSSPQARTVDGSPDMPTARLTPCFTCGAPTPRPAPRILLRVIGPTGYRELRLRIELCEDCYGRAARDPLELLAARVQTPAQGCK